MSSFTYLLRALRVKGREYTAVFRGGGAQNKVYAPWILRRARSHLGQLGIARCAFNQLVPRIVEVIDLAIPRAETGCRERKNQEGEAFYLCHKAACHALHDKRTRERRSGKKN